MTVQTEPKKLEDVLLYEQLNRMSRATGVFQTGNTFSIGQVLGKDYKAITGFVQNSGTNLTESDVSLAPKAKKGDYEIHGTGTDTGYMVDPDGYHVDDFDAIAYDGEHLNIDSGSVAADDKYTVTVGDSTGDYVPLDPAAVNGAHEAHGIALDAYDASGGDVDGVALIKEVVLQSGGVVWPDGISTANKETALEQLAALGIVTRDAV